MSLTRASWLVKMQVSGSASPCNEASLAVTGSPAVHHAVSHKVSKVGPRGSRLCQAAARTP